MLGCLVYKYGPTKIAGFFVEKNRRTFRIRRGQVDVQIINGAYGTNLMEMAENKMGIQLGSPKSLLIGNSYHYLIITTGPIR